MTQTFRIFTLRASLAISSLIYQCAPAQEVKEPAKERQDSDEVRLVAQLHQKWRDDSFQVRAEASEHFLASLPVGYITLCQELVKQGGASKDPEIKARTEKVLKKIYRRKVIGEGLSETGLTFGWFIEMHDGLPTSYPLVIEVAEEGPGKEGGFVRGDVILTMNEENFQSIESRNLLVQKLADIPPETELVFRVKNSTKDRDVAYDKYHKNWKGVRKLTTAHFKKSRRQAELVEQSYLSWRAESIGE